MLQGVLNCLLGDLVKHQPLDRDRGLEHLEQVPGDGLALAILIGGEQQFVRLHNHSDYSLLDGAMKTGAMAKRAADIGLAVDDLPMQVARIDAVVVDGTSLSGDWWVSNTDTRNYYPAPATPGNGVSVSGDFVLILHGSLTFPLRGGFAIDAFAHWGNYAGLTATGFESREIGVRLRWTGGS